MHRFTCEDARSWPWKFPDLGRFVVAPSLGCSEGEGVLLLWDLEFPGFLRGRTFSWRGRNSGFFFVELKGKHKIAQFSFFVAGTKHLRGNENSSFLLCLPKDLKIFFSSSSNNSSNWVRRHRLFWSRSTPGAATAHLRHSASTALLHLFWQLRPRSSDLFFCTGRSVLTAGGASVCPKIL